MIIRKKMILASMLSVLISPLFASNMCCGKMGGVSYCDSSAGRLVCSNGYYSDCYCTRHAIMDLQLLKGCCLWQGGVRHSYARDGKIMCNDGSVSEECSNINFYDHSMVYPSN